MITHRSVGKKIIHGVEGRNQSRPFFRRAVPLTDWWVVLACRSLFLSCFFLAILLSQIGSLRRSQGRWKWQSSGQSEMCVYFHYLHFYFCISICSSVVFLSLPLRWVTSSPPPGSNILHSHSFWPNSFSSQPCLHLYLMIYSWAHYALV